LFKSSFRIECVCSSILTFHFPNIFNPEGRLEQVENSVKTIALAGSVVGLKCKDGIILAGEKSITTKLMVGVKREKTAVLDTHIVTAYAGMSSDANKLIEWCREECIDWSNKFDRQIDCENVAKSISDQCH
jgi:20S proteasome alpha/beta subunit